MGSASPSLLFTFGSCNVYSTDLALLQSAQSWINDSLLHLHMAALQAGEVRHVEPRCCAFLAPETTFVLLHEEGNAAAH